MLLSTNKRMDHFVDSPDAYSQPGRCSRCNTNGFWLTPMGIVTECPNWQLRYNDHPAPTPAAEAILRAGKRLQFAGLKANPVALDVARALTRGTTAEPVDRQTLLDRYFGWAASQRLRKFHHVIEELRSVWLLPVGSRKSKPHGYWLIVDEVDFREWVERTTSAPIKQLTTIHAVARANFPVFAEQLDFEFWKDMADQYSPADQAPPPAA